MEPSAVARDWCSLWPRIGAFGAVASLSVDANGELRTPLDRVERILSEIFGFCRHDGDGFALTIEFLRQRIQPAGGLTRSTRYILVRENVGHARHFLGRRRVDILDSRVRMRTREQLHVKQVTGTTRGWRTAPCL